MAYKVITPPSVEPVSVAELRVHRRLDALDTTENALIATCISAAREWIERYIGAAVAEQTVEIALDAYPTGPIELPGGAVSSVTSVKFFDSAGSEVTLSNLLYTLDDYSTPNWLLMAYGTTWPTTTYTNANAIKVRYVVGSGVCPAPVKAALLLLAGHLYENREEVSASQTFALPLGVKALLASYRVNLGF